MLNPDVSLSSINFFTWGQCYRSVIYGFLAGSPFFSAVVFWSGVQQVYVISHSIALTTWELTGLIGTIIVSTRKKKKNVQPKFESYVLCDGQAQETTSQITLSQGGGKGGARIHRSFCNKGQVAETSKDYCYLKKTISQGFSAFEVMHACVLSCVWLFVTPWAATSQAPLSMEFPGKNTEWTAIHFSRGFFWHKDLTCVSCISFIGRQILYPWPTRKAHFLGGICKSLDSLKTLLWYSPQLSRASILCFLILSFFKLHYCGWL